MTECDWSQMEVRKSWQWSFHRNESGHGYIWHKVRAERGREEGRVRISSNRLTRFTHTDSVSLETRTDCTSFDWLIRTHFFFSVRTTRHNRTVFSRTKIVRCEMRKKYRRKMDIIGQIRLKMNETTQKHRNDDIQVPWCARFSHRRSSSSSQTASSEQVKVAKTKTHLRTDYSVRARCVRRRRRRRHRSVFSERK